MDAGEGGMIVEEGIDLIKSFEGLYLRRYLDPIGIPTIGYGSIHWWDGGAIPEGATLADEDEAVKLMMLELAPTEASVRRIYKGGGEYRTAALVSFAYNCGLGNLKASTLLRKANAGLHDEAGAQFLRWNKAGGKVLAGLTRRRKAEMNLYLSEEDNDLGV